MYLFLGQFTVPSVSGQCCLPTGHFTINKINQNKGIMIGGIVFSDDPGAAANDVYIFNMTPNTIVSYYYVHVQYIPVPHVYYLISALLIFSNKLKQMK